MESYEYGRRGSVAATWCALAGVAKALPALKRAQKLGKRAAGVGFDWPDSDGVRAKIREELSELDAAMEADKLAEAEEELGDLLFAVVNLARKLGVDPRAAMEKANRKFESRFGALEALAKMRGIRLGEADLETLDELWDVVKAGEDAQASDDDQG